MKKKLLAMVLALAMSFSVAVPAYAAEGQADDTWTEVPGALEHDKNEIHGDPNNKDLGVGFGETDLTIKVISDRCDHQLVYTQDASGTTHSATCSVCGESIVTEQMCLDLDENLKCDQCERTMKCTEIHFEYWANSDGKTHNKLCTSSGHGEHVLVANEPHVTTADDTTHCKLCGATIGCEHPETEVVSNDNLTHSIICSVCNATVSDDVACTDRDGDGDHKCDTEGCTNIIPCKYHGSDNKWTGDEAITWTYNSTLNRHEASCPDQDCNETVWGECVDAGHDCICDVCGNVKHTPRWIQNTDHKTHTYKCSVCGDETIPLPGGSTVRKETHMDTGDSDGYCDKCGFKMSDLGAPVMVAEIPATIPIVATKDGKVTVPTNAAIVNKSDYPLWVVGMQVSTKGWKPEDTATDFTKLSSADAGEGFRGYMGINLRGMCLTGGAGQFYPSEWTIPAHDELPLNIAVKISAQTAVVDTPVEAGTIRISLAWHPTPDSIKTPAKDVGATDQKNFNKAVGDTVYTVTIQNAAEVHYTIKGNISEFETDAYGYILQLPDVIADEGYIFTGWAILGGGQVSNNQKIDGDITIVPGVIKIPDSN